MRAFIRALPGKLLPGSIALVAGVLLLGVPASGDAPQADTSQGVQANVASQVSWGSANGCFQNIQTNNFGELTPSATTATLGAFDATPEAQASTDSNGKKVWVGCVTTNGPLASVVAQGIRDMADSTHDILPLSDVAIGVTNHPGGVEPQCSITADQSAGGSCTLVDDGTTVRPLVGEAPAGTTEIDWQYQLDLPGNQETGSYTGGEVIFTASASAPTSAPVNTAPPEISPHAQRQGVTADATPGAWTESPTAYAYQWQRCESTGAACVDITGASASSYTPTAVDVGHTLRVQVTASNAVGDTSATSAATEEVLSSAPENTKPPVITPSAPEQGVAESVSEGTWANSPTGFSYQWKRCDDSGENCSDITGADTSAYTPGQNDVGHTLIAEVSATNASGTTTASSEPTSQVAAEPPASSTPPPEISGQPIQGDTLTATHGTFAGGEVSSYEFQWLRCDSAGENCTAIFGATKDSYVLGEDDAGHTLAVEVNASNSSGSASETSAPTAVIIGPPILDSAPDITPHTPQQDILESVSDGSWSNEPTSYSYQWQRCDGSGENCTSIAGANESTYTPTAADVGHTLKAEVSASNQAGETQSTSEATAQVLPAPPTNSAAPNISPSSPQQGLVESATNGTWSNAPTSFAYQWQDCNSAGEDCAAIPGARSSSYTPVEGDVGSTLRVEVSASNAGGEGSAFSAVSEAVLPAAPVNTAVPAVTNDNPTVASAESATTGTWSNNPTSYSYQWSDCNSAGEGCAEIPGATSSTYTPVPADAAHTLVVSVTASNSGGTGAGALSSHTNPVTEEPSNSQLPALSTNDPTEGVPLSLTNGTWAGYPDPAYTYQWQRCNAFGSDCVDIPSATSSTYIPARADVGNTLQGLVTASNSAGTSTATTLTSNIVTGPPANTSPPSLSSSSAVEGSALSATSGTWSGYPEPTYTYQWEDCDSAGENCSIITGATSSSYTPVEGDVGHTLKARVTATNSVGESSAFTPASNVALPRPPANTAAPTLSSDKPQQGVLLQVANGTWSRNPTSFAYQWEDCDSAGENCTDIAGATSSSYSPVEGDVGHTLRARVSASNSGGSTSATSAASEVVVPPAPVNSASPSISPTSPQQGVSESATNGTWSNNPTSFAYQWEDCNSAGESCTAISGATSSTYTPVEGDVGATLRVAVTATNAGGSASSTSSASSAVLPAAPGNSAPPAISPTSPQQGSAESVTNGTWSNSPTSYSYQWEDCNSAGESCTNISGATSSTYTPVTADVGHTLRAEVTATNPGGSTSATSSATSTVTGSAPANTSPPVITPSSPQQGSIEIVSNGSWTNSPTSFTRQWEDCNSVGESCTNISGATSSTYTPTASDVGFTLRVKVTAINSSGSGTATAAATSAVTRTSHTQSIDSGTSLNAVSCIPSTSDCVASDAKGNAFYSTAVKTTASSTWTSWSGPGLSPSEALACPSTSLCVMADEGDMYYATSLGGTWANAFNPSYGVDAVTCPTSSFCVDGQGGGGGFIRYSTAPNSTNWNAVDIAEGTSVTGVACTSSSFCAAVNNAGKVYVAESLSQIQAESWTATSIDGSTALTSIACLSTTSCMATDGVGNVLVMSISGLGSATVTKHNIDGTNDLTAIACTTSSTCVATDSVGNIFITTNAGSTWVKSYALGDKLTSVSCASLSLCAAVDTTGNVITFEG